MQTEFMTEVSRNKNKAVASENDEEFDGEGTLRKNDSSNSPERLPRTVHPLKQNILYQSDSGTDYENDFSAHKTLSSQKKEIPAKILTVIARDSVESIPSYSSWEGEQEATSHNRQLKQPNEKTMTNINNKINKIDNSIDKLMQIINVKNTNEPQQVHQNITNIVQVSVNEPKKRTPAAANGGFDMFSYVNSMKGA